MDDFKDAKELSPRIASPSINAVSASCESIMVVVHDVPGSGGNCTRVIIPGTSGENTRDTNVDIKDDFPTMAKEKMISKGTPLEIAGAHTIILTVSHDKNVDAFSMIRAFHLQRTFRMLLVSQRDHCFVLYGI